MMRARAKNIIMMRSVKKNITMMKANTKSIITMRVAWTLTSGRLRAGS